MGEWCMKDFFAVVRASLSAIHRCAKLSKVGSACKPLACPWVPIPPGTRLPLEDEEAHAPADALRGDALDRQLAKRLRRIEELGTALYWEVRFVLGDLHYNAPNVQKVCEPERLLASDQRGACPLSLGQDAFPSPKRSVRESG